MDNDASQELLLRLLAAERDPQKRGDCFERLIKPYLPLLYTIAVRMLGNEQDAEDVTQDALLNAYRAISKHPEVYTAVKLKAYLCSIIRNECIDQYRRNRRLQSSISLDTPGLAELLEDDDRSQPECVAENAERREAAIRAILDLSDTLRETAFLHFIKGMTVNEIAELLGELPGTIKTRLQRSKLILSKALKAFMKEEY